VPMVRAETEGRAGKRDGQPAHTREAKLGCVFRQTTVDRDGRPVREEGSTTYVGAIETAEEFGLRLYTEAGHRGWARAEKKVVIGDGAEWIWNIVQLHFPDAIQICGSVSCAPAPVGTRGQTLPQRCSPPEALDDDQAGQTGQR